MFKVKFLRNVPEHIDKPFTLYDYNEGYARHDKYIDMRKIVEEKRNEWLDDVQKSHAGLSELFLKHSRWWWVSPMSRLDARPWGQEHLFKPMFFAMAIIEWGKSCDTGEILVVGSSSLVKVYLKEFDPAIALENGEQIPYPLMLSFRASKSFLIAIIKMSNNAFHIFKHHIFHKKNTVSAETLVFYELFSSNISLEEARTYYYDSLFGGCDGRIAYGCLESSGSDLAKLRKEKDPATFFILDSMILRDLIKSLRISMYILWLSVKVVSLGPECRIGGYISKVFWREFILYELASEPALNYICCYMALRSLPASYKSIIYTYEEKGSERAVLFASLENNISTVGYVPHPQHRLTLSLRGGYTPSSPKPARYALCGSAYLDYFKSWGCKKRDSLTVWGSAKSGKGGDLCVPRISFPDRKILLVLSHPNELRIFYSWLQAEKRLSYRIRYTLRIYKAVLRIGFSDMAEKMLRDFTCLELSTGSLLDDVKRSDIVAFCATSAGIVAINHGRIAVYVSLNDFFNINPCFDRMEEVLPSYTASQFADRIDELSSLDEKSLGDIYKRQRSLSESIFSPIRHEAIRNEILC